MKKIVLVLSLLVAVWACSEDRSGVEKLEKEVMGVHDEVMPQMSRIMELQEQVSQQIATTDSLVKLTATPELEKQKADGLAVAEALRDADTAMMDWMHNYQADSLKTLKVADAMPYLEAEKVKINTVRDKMLQSINQAQQFLGSNP
jgi:HSP90 family molecular chaperone